MSDLRRYRSYVPQDKYYVRRRTSLKQRKMPLDWRKLPLSERKRPSVRRRLSIIALLDHHYADLAISKDEELEAIRAGFIYEEQRVPTNKEQRVRHCDLARLGPLLPAFLRRLKENDSRSVFELEQQQWTHLAGEWSRYWRLGDGKQTQPDKPLYAPLDAAKREIRVLQVSRVSPVDSNRPPGDGSNAAFKANLLHVSLDDDPAYIAISYAWGDRSPVGRFQSDQEGAAEFEYNRAVFEILDAVVPEGSTLYLWIDALCVNQRDDVERGIQVALMSEVFGKARQVVVFLGEADEDTTTNMDLLYRAGPVMEVDCPRIFHDHHLARVEAESTKAEIPLRAWRSVHCLMSRRWFTRYWVIQEVALGTHPVVTCGRHAVSWDLFSTVYSWLDGRDSMISSLVDGTLPYEGTSYLTKLLAQPWANLRYLTKTRQEEPLVYQWMINNFDRFEATDPRDRVFAITGLASLSEAEEEDFRPDYNVRVEELYTQVARRLLMKDDGVETLYRAGIGFPRLLGLLPSWVPDWTSKREWDYLYNQPTKRKPHPAGLMEFRVGFVPESPRVATLHGCVVDSVVRLGPTKDVYFRTRPWSERHEADRHWTESVLELIASYTPAFDLSTASRNTPSGPSWWKYCLWGTLLANQQQKVFEECVFDRYLEQIGCSARKPWDPPDPKVEERAWGFTRSARNVTYGRRFFVSSKGYFGLTSPGTQEGDLVCVFAGMKTPIIIRPVVSEGPDPPSTPGSYVLVGEAYHHGIAEGKMEFEPESMGPIRLV